MVLRRRVGWAADADIACKRRRRQEQHTGGGHRQERKFATHSRTPLEKRASCCSPWPTGISAPSGRIRLDTSVIAPPRKDQARRFYSGGRAGRRGLLT